MGSIIAYKVIATNSGTVTLTNMIVSDLKLNPNQKNCASVAPGTTCALLGNYTVTQGDVDAGQVINNSSVIANPPSGSPLSANDSVTTPITQSSSLTVTKAALTANYNQVGDILNYTIDVTNTGNTILSTVNLNDTNANISTCTPSVPVASLAPGAVIHCSASHTVTQLDLDAGYYTNTATATGTAPLGAPVDGTSNIVTIPAQQTQSISVVKTSGDTSYATVGQILNYEITLTNTSNNTLTNVSISDSNAVISNCTKPSGSSLSPNDTMQCSASHVVSQTDINAGVVVNSATGSATGPVGPFSQVSNVVTINAAQTPTLSIVKTSSDSSFATLGQTLTYAIELTNTGNTTLNNVNITDNNALLSTCTPSLPVAVLEPGSKIKCSATHNVTQADINAGSIANRAMGSAGSVQGYSNIVTTPYIPTQSAIKVEESANIQSFSYPGTPITLTFVVSNIGQAALSDIVLTDLLLGTIKCPKTTLAAGETMSVQPVTSLLLMM